MADLNGRKEELAARNPNLAKALNDMSDNRERQVQVLAEAVEMSFLEKEADVYEDRVLEKIEDSGETWTITDEDGWFLGVTKVEGVEPKPGDIGRYYGRGIGSPVRGLDINGVEVYWESEEEYTARRLLEQTSRDADSKKVWEAKRGQMDQALLALPEEFQMRILRFRKNLPDFGWKHEDYEMASCKDAALFAKTLTTPEEVDTFQQMTYAEQRHKIPEMGDGHSGNTFAMACRLAWLYLKDPTLVWQEHAAISALLGCKDSGCEPITDKVEEEKILRGLMIGLVNSTRSCSVESKGKDE